MEEASWVIGAAGEVFAVIHRPMEEFFASMIAPQRHGVDEAESGGVRRPGDSSRGKHG